MLVLRIMSPVLTKNPKCSSPHPAVVHASLKFPSASPFFLESTTARLSQIGGPLQRIVVWCPKNTTVHIDPLPSVPWSILVRFFFGAPHNFPVYHVR
mmetsp:Transcript_19895/g.30624  ORF Transcript_19895/g.30624 Transcript_19895/m.30624 type:complete len:97 (-) Transcript_19895:459-749(-)